MSSSTTAPILFLPSLIVMQQRWEGNLSKAVEDAPRIREHAASAPSVLEQAQDARARVEAHTGAAAAPASGTSSTKPSARRVAASSGFVR
jgi:hypothetical protein